MIWQTILAFGALAALDFVFALYTIKLATNKIFAGACYAMAILLFGGIAQIIYVHNPVMLIPAALGAFIGTFLGGRVGHRYGT